MAECGQITIEAVAADAIDDFWAIHYDYLVRDNILPDNMDPEFFGSRTYRKPLEERMQHTVDPHRVVFFLRDGQRIGAAQYTVFRSEDGRCFIKDFWVFQGHRGRSIGRACFHALKDAAAKDGARYFELICLQEPARRFWARHGFVYVGVDASGFPLYRDGPLLTQRD